MKPYQQRIYERYASVTGDSQDRKPDRHAIARLRWQLRGLLPDDRESRILDVGAGTGTLLSCLMTDGYSHAAGVDISGEQIERACGRGIENIHQSDAVEWLKGHPNSYDCIVALDLLEHLEKDGVLDLLDAVRVSLVSGGCLILRVPNVVFTPMLRYADFTHETAFTPSSLRQLFAVCGFADVSVRECTPEPVSFFGVLRFFLWQLCRLLVGGFFLIATGNMMGRVYTLNLIGVARKDV